MVQKIHIQDKFQPCILSRLTDRSLTGNGSAEDSLLSRIHREILLNLKGLCAKMYTDEPQIIRIEAQGEGEITAGDII